MLEFYCLEVFLDFRIDLAKCEEDASVIDHSRQNRGMKSGDFHVTPRPHPSDLNTRRMLIVQVLLLELTINFIVEPNGNSDLWHVLLVSAVLPHSASCIARGHNWISISDIARSFKALLQHTASAHSLSATMSTGGEASKDATARPLSAQATPPPDTTSATDPSQPEPIAAPEPASTAPPNTCSLHIRLFDGSSIRSQFSADATLSTAVRTFVSTRSSTDSPYNFRLMDLPRQSRTIEISEESHSLRDLGLCPNATLVLVPVRDFTDAYASDGARGVLQKSVSLGFNLVSGAFSLVGGAIGRATGYELSGEDAGGPYIAGTGDDPTLNAAEQENKPSGEGPTIRVNTLASQRAKEKPDFYNGNQLSVQPRPEDKDE